MTTATWYSAKACGSIEVGARLELLEGLRTSSHSDEDDLGHRMHPAGQGLGPSISIKFWISALEKSAILLHFEDMLILGVVLSAVAGFLCLFLLWGFSF